MYQWFVTYTYNFVSDSVSMIHTHIYLVLYKLISTYNFYGIYIYTWLA
jgi:hypothetical protein